MELYRREFEFMRPVFPEEDEDNQSEQDQTDQGSTDDYQGKNEVINGIEIETHALFSPSTTKKKSLSLVAKAEETKVNFFNPNLDDDQLERSEEHQIIETKIDPLEWNKEVEAVYRDLVRIE